MAGMGTVALRRAALVVALVMGMPRLCGTAPARAQTLNQTSGPWVMERSGTTAGLRGIHAVGGGVAWASGTNGTILRTEDGGYEWQSCAAPPDSARLDFRGIWAWDANTAIVMSSGTGDASRLYKTTDGCSSWKLLFTNPDKDGFWDAVAFGDRNYGILLGDPTVDEYRYVSSSGTHSESHLEMTIFVTLDGGVHWNRQRSESGKPPLAVLQGTGAFAASNSALFIEDRNAWFGVGGEPGPSIFLGDQYAPVPFGICDCFAPIPSQIWFTGHAHVPLASGTPSSGVFSLAFRYLHYGVAVGGDYTKPNDSAGTAVWSWDAGKTWTASAKPPHGFRSAVAWDDDAKAWIAAGTNGSDISYDDGKTWVALDGPDTGGNWNALSLPWVVGPNGRIAKLDRGKLPKPNPK